MPECQRKRNVPATPLTVERLVRIKRLERPAPNFWADFDREMQQKQLRALVRPTRTAKLRVLLARFGSPAWAAAVAGAALLAGALAMRTDETAQLAAGPEHVSGIAAGDLSGSEWQRRAGGEADSAEAGVRAETGGPLFVEDILRPVSPGEKSFRTIAKPETLTGGARNSAFYVINDFTTSVETLRDDHADLGF